MNAKAVVPLVFGLTVAGASAAYLLYLFLKRDEDDLSALDSNLPRIKTSRQTQIEVKIPKECVGVVIGRGGITIKGIQEKTDTKIHFKDELETEQHRVCIVRGTGEGAQLAEYLIHDIILNQPLIETQEIFVPQYACGRIIGRNGENIRSISRTSNAKITVEGTGANELGNDRRITIKGTAEQIQVAKSLIDEKIAEDAEARGRIRENLEKRSPRKRLGPQYLMSAEQVEEQVRRHNTESLLATGKDGFMEVYVSAVEHPGRFWVQVIGPRAVELDHLVEEMTEYYKQDINRELHQIKEITAEQVVAAPFSHDDKWYRARVTEVTLDDYDVEDSQILLYYLDYGDSDTRRKKDVCSMRTDFLKLKYQAIECSLAKVKPQGDVWTDEAIDLFEDLCHVAQWRVLIARVDSHKERERGQREGSPIPLVELYDTSGTQDICMGEELVKQGYADWEKAPDDHQASTSKPSTPKTVSRVERVASTDLAGVKSNTFSGSVSDNKVPDKTNEMKTNNNVINYKSDQAVVAAGDERSGDEDEMEMN